MLKWTPTSQHFDSKVTSTLHGCIQGSAVGPVLVGSSFSSAMKSVKKAPFLGEIRNRSFCSRFASLFTNRRQFRYPQVSTRDCHGVFVFFATFLGGKNGTTCAMTSLCSGNVQRRQLVKIHRVDLGFGCWKNILATKFRPILVILLAEGRWHDRPAATPRHRTWAFGSFGVRILDPKIKDLGNLGKSWEIYSNEENLKR